MTTPPAPLVQRVAEIRHPSVEDLRAMGDDGLALDAIYRAARMIGEQNGTVGSFDHTVWGELQIAANRYQDLLAALDALARERDQARDALALFVKYDDSDPDFGGQMMIAYNDAITAARAALTPPGAKENEK